MSHLKRILAVLAALLLLPGLSWLLGRLCRSCAQAPALRARLAWLPIFEHHLWQLLVALLLIGLLSRGDWRGWGLNLQGWRLALRYLTQGFFPVLAGSFLLVNVLPFLYQGRPPGFDYPLSAANVIGWLLLLWLFVGLSEEILFRGLVQTALQRCWPQLLRCAGLELPVAGLLAALVFALAHIDVELFPLRVVAFSIPQLILVFIAGSYYAVIYHRTGSLLHPILAHNITNGLVWLAGYLLVWLM